MTVDTGLLYLAKSKMIYVQLDKCLKQFREGRNAEDEEGKPDRLQAWLAAIADVNDKKVAEESEKDEELAGIRKEAHDMVQEKEVQNMVIISVSSPPVKGKRNAKSNAKCIAFRICKAL